MHSFKDQLGFGWELRINFASIRQVKDLTRIDLPGLFGDKLKPLDDFLSDPVKVGTVLWILVRDQAEKAKKTEEDFAAALCGDAFEEAAQALIWEIVDFFPKAKGTPLRTLLEKVKTGSEKVLAMTTAQLDTVNVDEMVEKALAILGEKSKESAGSVPVS